MRLLWVSNPPFVGSGYGEQTALFSYRLRDQGHDMAGMANFGLQGNARDWHGMTWYPADNQWGNLGAPLFAKHHQAEGIIALCDAWVMHPDKWLPSPRWAIWAPVDHHPLPPGVKATLEHPRVVPVAMSRFGERMMKDAGLDPCYIPHGVDTELFRPVPEMRREVREEMLQIPEDVFLVGMVAANKGNPSVPRKAFPQAFEAFSRFAKRHEDAWMYVHSTAIPDGGGGISLDKLAEAVEMPAGRLRFPPEENWLLGMSRNVVAAIYQSLDCLLMPSMGEGFGIPLLEAQACGVPVITSDHSAMSELGRGGWLIEGERWWDPLQESFLHAPSVGAIETALENAYERRDDQALKDAAVQFAAPYDADLLMPMWDPVLERLAEPVEVPPLKLNGHLNRAQRRALAKKQPKVTA